MGVTAHVRDRTRARRAAVVTPHAHAQLFQLAWPVGPAGATSIKRLLVNAPTH